MIQAGSAGESRRRIGFVEWFRRGEYDRVRATMAGMREVGAARIRTHLSWAEFHTADGSAWYDWLIPTLGSAFELLPCVHYTPPSLSRTGRTAGPPRRLRDFADFVDQMLTRYGEHFSHIELWNEPNNLLDWDWREDRDWLLFCEMVGAAAHWTQQRGWQAVLGGPCPFDANWLGLMGERGVLATVSAIGFHAFPGTWDSEAAGWLGYDAHLAELRDVVGRYNPGAEIWITEAGYSTWRRDEAAQVEQFRAAFAAPADRVYWYGWQDIPVCVPVQQGLYFDPRHYHLGVTDAAGRPKLLRRLLASQDVLAPLAAAVPAAAPFAAPASATPRLVRAEKPVLVFGGAGFVGANLADALMRDGHDVIVYDNLSRPGVERNLAWLAARHGPALRTRLADIRDPAAVADAVKQASAIYHLAAQVAVTSSLVDPLEDFSINAQGTFTILEAIRAGAPETPMVFASTNKVYGALADIAWAERDDCYVPQAPELRRHGIDETRPLDFCTPYGCSKGAADQYVLDYAHSFGLRTAVLRKSCIYGPRQFGTEDQGWVAHFLIRALRGAPITIYGDGKQVRDILHVTDAVAAYRALMAGIDESAGCAFNLGGGPENAVSLLAVLDAIARITPGPVTPGPVTPGPMTLGSARLVHADPRAGDQLYFVADTRRLQAATGWRPTIGWRDGIADLADWLRTDLGLEVAEMLPLSA
jgi:CDP-paratose 2-epimerase